MSKIKEAFAGGKAFIPFITCGDPDLETTEKIIEAMAESGADLIELGIPFSDPTAEGPVIQKGNLRALSGGVTTDKVFDMVRRVRQKVKIPMVFMTYANVVFSYGTERFLTKAAEVGIDGLILPDVPYEEKAEFAPQCEAAGLDLISIKWLEYLRVERSLQNEWVDTTNLYIKFMQARGYLNVMQYERARICFKSTAAYSELIGQTWLCVGSLFGQAAAVWEQGETQEAVKMSAQALTMGIQYKYTGIFTEYGQTGVRLIEAYRKMTGLDDNLSMAGRKKKYYYGNVMTASYEGYHSILLRKARKEMRYGQSQEEKDQVRTALTMTEVLILQYIANGYSNKEIGEKMNIRLTTVKTHVYSIYRKLDVSSRVMAINRAKALNIL